MNQEINLETLRPWTGRWKSCSYKRIFRQYRSGTKNYLRKRNIVTHNEPELTDEELLQLAKWLGRYYEVYDVVLIENDNGKLTLADQWFDSAEGERALMDKLGELCVERKPDLEFEVFFITWSALLLHHCWCVWIGRESGLPETEIAKVYHPIRVRALHRAILEMLKDEK